MTDQQVQLVTTHDEMLRRLENAISAFPVVFETELLIDRLNESYHDLEEALTNYEHRLYLEDQINAGELAAKERAWLTKS